MIPAFHFIEAFFTNAEHPLRLAGCILQPDSVRDRIHSVVVKTAEAGSLFLWGTSLSVGEDEGDRGLFLYLIPPKYISHQKSISEERLVP